MANAGQPSIKLLPTFATVLLVIVWITAVGCAGRSTTLHSARSAFHQGDSAAAAEILSQISNNKDRDSDAAALDLAMVQLASGNLAAAENDLRLLRDRFESQPATHLIKDSASMLTDDTARAFRPAGYEQVMIRAMLAVCSLAGDAIDAEAYALQATEKQNKLRIEAEAKGIPSAADHFQPIAVAPYLRGVLREATHHDYDDASRAYQLVSAAMPSFAPAADDIQRATTGAHSRPGHGVLYVIACVGQGPQLVPAEAPTTSTALSIASSVLNAETNKQSSPDGEPNRVGGPVLPNIASVKVPKVVVPDSKIAAVGMRVGGKLYGATQTLTDVGQLAISQTEAEMPWTLARAILRRTTKELAVAKVGDSMGLDGAAGSLFHFAAASAWAGSEKADVRCWGLLPREIQVLRAELPVGSHTITLQPLGHGGSPIAAGITRTVDMVDGRNTYAVVIAPGETMYCPLSPSSKTGR